MKKTMLIAIAFGLLSNYSHAARNCVGNVSKIGLGQWGDTVYMYSDSMFGDSHGRKLCQISFDGDETKYKNISGEMCKLWYSSLLSAFMAEKKITFDYGGNNANKGCHDRADWQNFTPPIQIIIVKD